MKRETRAIILKRTAYGDADWIVTFFSKEYGRMSGMAKSARASRKRFGGALEPGSIVRLQYVERRAGNLVRLEEAVIDRVHLGIMKSLERIEAMARAVDIANAFLQEYQAAPDKFDLLEGWLTHINEVDPKPWEQVAYELRWLVLSGFQPQLDSCVACGDESSHGDRWAFDLEKGGVICSPCSGNHGTLRLKRTDVESLISLIGFDGDPVEDVAVPSVVVDRYLQHVLGRPLKFTRIMDGE
jgi:DNA repair protein RecO (recombination protein O)